jgi:hypothetical protein
MIGEPVYADGPQTPCVRAVYGRYIWTYPV